MSKKRDYYLVMYDIQQAARLRQIVKILKAFGMRVQKSVFECLLDKNEFNAVKSAVTQIIREQDSVRLYPLDPMAMERKTVLGEILYAENPPETLIL